MNKSLINRFIVSMILWIIALVFDFLGGFLWSVFILLISLLAFREFIKLFQARKVSLSRFWIRLSILAFMFAPLSLRPEAIFLNQGFLIALSFTIILLRMLLRTSRKTHFDDIAASLWSIIYLGFFPSFYIWTRELPNGFVYIIILVMTVGMNDIAAMLLGKLFGKRPLSPQLSPKKTIEGSISGLVVGSLTFALLVKFYGLGLNQEVFYDLFHTLGLGFEFFVFLIMGFMICFIAQIGDLVESLLKREAGVKDSGTLLQAHGGVLDRIDSHYFSAWVGYFIFYYLIV